MALLYGRAGRLTAKNGGFRPGQWCDRAMKLLRQTLGEANQVAEAGQQTFSAPCSLSYRSLNMVCWVVY